MLMDLSQLTGTIYLYGDEPKLPAQLLKLYSKYNNKYILNGDFIFGVERGFRVNILSSRPNWYSYRWEATNTAIITEDIGGYYEMEFYNTTDPERIEQVMPSILVKVTNNWETKAIVSGSTVFESDNETNEQYTFFR